MKGFFLLEWDPGRMTTQWGCLLSLFTVEC